MARSDSFDLGTAGAESRILDAGNGQTVAVPHGDFITNAEILRDGQDLVLRAPNGETVVIENYFSVDPAPLIAAPNGAMLTPELVRSFVQSAGREYASLEQGNDASPIGGVKEVTGEATVTRTDGTTQKITVGMPVFEGDIIETEGDAAVNILFIDESEFAVSADARLAIDEYVFDPSTATGESNFSVLRGLFVYSSGLIGREDPDDVSISTPIGSIGIRGTTIAGNVTTGEITVVEGAIVLRSPSGEEVTLATQFETARFNPQGGTIESLGVKDAATLGQSFGAIGAVAPSFFNAIGATPGGNTTGNDAAPVGNSGSTNNPGNEASTSNNEAANNNTGNNQAPAVASADLSMNLAGNDSAFAPESSFDSAAAADSSSNSTGAASSTSSAASSSSSGSSGAATAAAASSSDAGGTSDSAGTGGTTSIAAPPPPPSVINPSAGSGTATVTPPVIPPVTPPPPTTNSAPVINNAGASIIAPEDSPLNTLIATVNASDVDGQTLSYSIITGNGAGLFTINSAGEIRLTGYLDFENVQQHVLTIGVSDDIDRTDATFTINVGDINEAPQFTSALSTVASENVAANTVIHTFTAIDPENTPLTYTITGGNGGGLFDLDSATGALRVVGTLDYETIATHNLSITVSDGVLSATQNFTITLNNVDDESPVISINNGLSLNEGGTALITNMQLAATDADTGASAIVYQVTGTNAGYVAFTTTPTVAVTSFTQDDINNNRVIFVHDGRHATSASFTFHVGDGINAPTANVDFMVNVAVTNDSPVITGPQATLPDIPYGTLDGGQSVSSFAGGIMTDEESSQIGIAITGVDNSNGNWQYFNGTWITISGVSENNALLLSSSTLVRFVPNAGYAGTANFEFKAWDGDHGANFGYFDTVGDTAFSANSVQALVTVLSPPSSAPVLDLDTNVAGNDGTAHFIEGGSLLPLVGTNFSLTDDNGSQIIRLTVTLQNPVNGTAEGLNLTTAALANLNASGLTVTGLGTAVLVISGAASLSVYEQAISYIGYQNTAATPYTNPRQIVFEVMDDSNLTSAPATVELTITSSGGGYLVSGTAGDDTLSGGMGNDTFIASAGNDSYDGGPGLNTIDFSTAGGAVQIDLSKNQITQNGYGGAGSVINVQNIVGSDYNDAVYGDSAHNVLDLRGGDDVVYLGPGSSIVYAGDGNDVVIINEASGSVTLDGGAGIDIYDASAMTGLTKVDMTSGTVTRGTSTDTIINFESFVLGAGNDTIIATASVLSIDGGGGSNIIDMSHHAENLTFTSSNITGQFGMNIAIKNISMFMGGFGIDHFTDGAGDNYYNGREGNDIFVAGAGNNIYVGGAGIDTIDYMNAVTAVAIDLENNEASVNGFGGVDDISEIEIVYGSQFDDTISGALAVAETLRGEGGNDLITGQAGDTLLGGAGNDVLRFGTSYVGITLDGGTGNDTLQLLEGGTYSTSLMGKISGIETISTLGAAGPVTLNLVLNEEMFAQNEGHTLVLRGGSGHTLNIDLSAFGGDDAFYLVSGVIGANTDYILHSAAGAGYTLVVQNGGAAVNYVNGGPVVGLNLDAMTEDQGYWITGTDSRGFGHAVTGLGDRDGDGYDDIMIGHDATAGTLSDTRLIQIMGGAVTQSNTVDYHTSNSAHVSSLMHTVSNGTADFIMLAGGGDFDGDGIADLVIGSPYSGPNAAGSVYILSGLDNSIILSGSSNYTDAFLGVGLDWVGDVNGDGFDDVIIGGPGYNGETGVALLLYGGQGGTFTMSPGSAFGVRFDSPSSIGFGDVVAGIGDFNADGFDDFMISSPGASGTASAYVVFGGTVIDADVTAGGALQINGIGLDAQRKMIMARLGDINGDGIADIAIGSAGGDGEMNIILGNAGYTGSTTPTSMATLADITFSSSIANQIYAFNGVGDFNGDGFDDFALLLGGDTLGAMEMYVVFGKETMPASLNHSYLSDAANAYNISFDAGSYNPVTTSFTISAIGDVNGDGYADLALGITGIDNNEFVDSSGDTIANNDNDGAVAVIYGHKANSAFIVDTGTASGGFNIVQSSSDGQTLMGSSGNDILQQNGNLDLTFRGGAGNDVAEISHNDIRDIDLGRGDDALVFVAANETLDFSAFSAETIKGVERIRFGDDDQTIRLSLENIFDFMRSADQNELTIENDGVNSRLEIDIAGSGSGSPALATDIATALGATMTTDGNYYVFDVGNYRLSIDDSLFISNSVALV